MLTYQQGHSKVYVFGWALESSRFLYGFNLKLRIRMLL